MKKLVRFFSRKLKLLLLSHGFFIGKATSYQNLQNLADSLRPVSTNLNLIRVGGENDGGYILPDDLIGISACFSPGVDFTASFERHLLSSYGIDSHLADYSVDGPPENFRPKSFIKKFIGASNDNIFITLESWVKSSQEYLLAGEFILQMDIEGAEYSSLLLTSEKVLSRFRIIVIEIHNVESWADPVFFEIAQSFFKKLLAGYHVVHNHPNNCCGLANINGFIAPRVFEITLVRKDRCHTLEAVLKYPHNLDRPNISGVADLVLPENWR